MRLAVHQSVHSLNFCNIYSHRTANRLCYDFVIVNTTNIPVSMSAFSPDECSLNDIIHLCRYARQSEWKPANKTAPGTWQNVTVTLGVCDMLLTAYHLGLAFRYYLLILGFKHFLFELKLSISAQFCFKITFWIKKLMANSVKAFCIHLL